MREFLREILHALEAGQPVELVSVVRASGSTPRGAGAMMAVFKDGHSTGTVGGGSAEFESQQHALTLLKTGGEIHFKTDNAPLFAFSLEEFPQVGYALREVTDDLHADGPQGVMTDYEAKFHAEGIPIHRLVAAKLPWSEPEEAAAAPAAEPDRP